MKGISGVIILIALVFGSMLVIKTGIIKIPLAVQTIGTFANCLWQPDNCWATCQLNLYQSPIQSVPVGEAVQCSLSADIAYCNIESFSGASLDSADIYTSCSKGWFFGTTWDCTGLINSYKYSGARFERGRWIKFNRPLPSIIVGSLVIKSNKKELRSCGSSACSAGSGQIIQSADGCSWNPNIDGYRWPDNTTNAKEVPLGQSIPYVCSQHLVSCPSGCTDDLSCSVPFQSLKTFDIQYQGITRHAYVANGLTQIIGCKKSTTTACVNVTPNGTCLQTGTVEQSSCGTISTWSVGQCAQTSDCLNPNYVCKFDTTTGTGQCVPSGTYTPECTYDYDCSQTGNTKCVDKKLYTSACVSNQCTMPINGKDVQCCYGYDCQSGYYCDANYTCKKSQTVLNDCTYECCVNEQNYKNKGCTGDLTFCCPLNTDFGGSCKNNLDECTSTTSLIGNVPKGGETTKDNTTMWLILIIIVIVIMFLILGRGSGGSGSTVIIAK